MCFYRTVDRSLKDLLACKPRQNLVEDDLRHCHTTVVRLQHNSSDNEADELKPTPKTQYG